MNSHATVYYTKNGGYTPTQGYPTDTGWDLYTSEDVVIHPGEFMDVHTNIHVQLPPGVWCMVVGRSSTGRKHGLRVEMGIIDNEYTGELFVGVWNITNKPVTVSKGMRLAQLILFDLVPVVWQEVNKLGTTSRGSAGFGSTGVGTHGQDD